MTRVPRGVMGADVVKALEKSGFTVASTRGSHCKLRRDDRTVIVPLHRRELKPGTLASILRQAGLDADELRKLL